MIDCINEYLPLVRDSVLTTVAVFTAIAAWKGLSTWNEQLKGSVEYDLARRLLKSAYRIREAIKGVRNPVMFSNEMQSTGDEKRSSEKIRFDGVSQAYQNRWLEVDKIRIDLQADLLEAEVLWGKEIHSKFKLLNTLQLELYSQILTYLRTINPDESTESKQHNQSLYFKNREIIYEISTDNPDEFSQDIINAISDIETYLKPHLKK